MKKGRGSIRSPLGEPNGGSFLTPEYAKQVVQFINALKTLDGEKGSGIEVVMAEGNVVIKFSTEKSNLIQFGDVYNSEIAYAKNTIVVTRLCVVEDTDELVDCDDETAVEWKWGTWISLQQVPAGEVPVWPEPATPYWRMLALGVGDYKEVEVCVSGNSKLRTIVGSHVYEESEE